MKRRLIIPYLLAYLLAVALVLAAARCTSQVVRLSSMVLPYHRIAVSGTYDGPTFDIGSLSVTIWYDTAIYTWEGVTPCTTFDTTGVFVNTSPSQNLSTIGLGWWATDYQDTVWSAGRQLFTLYFAEHNPGCTPLNFLTSIPEWCELTNLSAVPQTTAWADTLLCHYDTYGKRKTAPERPLYDLYGRQITNPQGYYIQNRKLSYR